MSQITSLAAGGGGGGNITITGDTGGALGPASAFTFTGGSTGLSFNGVGTTETLQFAGITANAGTVNLGTDLTDNAIQIGTGANAGRSIGIGNSIGATMTAIVAGTGGIGMASGGLINMAASNNVTIDTSAGAGNILLTGSAAGIGIIAPGDINIATDATHGQINIGTNTDTSRIILMGSTANASQVVIQSGTGGIRTPQVFGYTVGGSGIPVVVDNAGFLGTIVSSQKYKDNITDMGSSTEDIFKLRPVTFTMKKEIEKSICWGLIAEEVEKIYPELVSYGKSGESESVKYMDLIPMLLNELQKLKKEVSQLKTMVK